MVREKSLTNSNLSYSKFVINLKGQVVDALASGGYEGGGRLP
jgi:hypothetical protein